MSSLAPPDALATAMRGSLIAPGDRDYDERRALYNAMIDRRPALIARCTDAADVIEAVAHARSERMPLAVRGGGLGSVDDGLVIDLSAMRGVIVDPVSRVARVLGGSLIGDVDHATQPFGLALPSRPGTRASTRAGQLPGPLRPARGDQGRLRPGELPQGQPEHRPRRLGGDAAGGAR